MKTLFAKSSDGTRIAYDRYGEGPAIFLLHGGGGRRQDWSEAGYVGQLQKYFTTITIDLRGHGQSGQPTDPAEYAIEKMEQDILAVADACAIDRFAIWGMSHGGKVGRYLGVRSERVTRLILMGTPLGPGLTGLRRQQALEFCDHWPPILQAQREGSLDLASLSGDDQDMLTRIDIAVMLGWVEAMLYWPTVEPADFFCPTLWLAGSEDQLALASIKEYEGSLKESQVQVHIVQGLDHEQLFDEIDIVLPIMLAFTNT